ncbi:hypothetical protein ACA910_005036 [Epithemia clementina (nom. ined.)]
MGTRAQQASSSSNDNKRKRRALSDDDGKTSNRPSKQQMVEQAANEDSLLLSKEHSQGDMSDVIAELSEIVLENPENAFRVADIPSEEKNRAKRANGRSTKDGAGDDEPQSRPSPMKQLLSIAAAQHSPLLEHTAHLAILSLLAIFKDIIPAYRIRLPDVKEMAVKVSKDTKQLWDYEKALLDHYQQFLKIMEKTWANKGKGLDNPPKVAIVAIISMAEMLKSAFHFNFRSNLLSAVIRPMNHPVVGDYCCAAISHIFSHDAQGEVSLEAARQVSKMIQIRNFKVRPAVIRTFVSLPLRVHVDEAQAAKLVTKANAKKRKKDKELASIQAELKEGDATVDKIHLARNQSDTLQAVTLTYFRILKHENHTAMRDVLPATLEGLAKFAHLINIDTVIDLLAVLKELLSKIETLPLDAALNCILTAFQTLQGPGKELQIDHKEYVGPLYCQIPRITSEENSLKHTELLLRCLSAAFLKQKEYSNIRVAAFVKQIMTASMHSPPHTAVPLLAFARQLFQRYPSAQQLLENENDVITSGEYAPDVIDPEQSNPYSTSGWELATLKFHIHSSIASQAKGAASSKLLQLPSEGPDRLRKETLEHAAFLYIPFHHGNIKKHPLSQKTADKKSRPRFITPRRTKSLFVEADTFPLDWKPLHSFADMNLAKKK